MRPDQLERLQQLSENLADRFLSDADPQVWSGGGKDPADMTQQERGDAYWCRKMAMATGGVLRYTVELLHKVKNPEAPRAPGSPEEAADEADIDQRIRDAQKRAAEAIARATIGKAKGKEEFDRRALGKR